MGSRSAGGKDRLVDDDLTEDELAFLNDFVDPCHGWSLETEPEDTPRDGPYWRGVILN